jgi:ribonuclease Z
MKPDQPLYLIANRATQLYLREYQDLQDLGIDDEGPAGVRVITCEDIEWREQEGAEEGDRLR